MSPLSPAERGLAASAAVALLAYGSLSCLWPAEAAAQEAVAVGGSADAEQEAFESPIRFREVSDAWGAGHAHRTGATGDYYMIETMGSGVVMFDYDDDGDTDLFYVDSGYVLGDKPDYETPPGSLLLRNDGVHDGRPVFVDVTKSAGLGVERFHESFYGMGATAGDVDGDGDLDLYVTAWGPNQLFRNQGDGTFVNVTEAAGVGVETWSASAAFGDVDGDGDLDLYVTDYLDFTWDNNPECGIQQKNQRSYCHPDVYPGMPDHLFRNRGDGTFEDVTEASGVGKAYDGTTFTGKGLGVVWSDLNGDGPPEIYVANDMTPNFHFENAGDGSLEEVAVLVGTAVSYLGREEAGMGIAARDVDGDGLVDLFVTHFDYQTNAFYGNLGGTFVDRRYVVGLGEMSLLEVGFGTDFLDLDLDADLDLAIANGHVVHNVELYGTGTTYRQRNQIFENVGGPSQKTKFEEVTTAGVDVIRSSRGLAAGDLDLDGDLDLVITNSNEPSEVYENMTERRGHWLQVDLRQPGPNQPALGAKIHVTTNDGSGGERSQLREVRTASSYMSQNPLTVHYGLGEADSYGLRIRWPWTKGEEAYPERPDLRILGLPMDLRVRVSVR